MAAILLHRRGNTAAIEALTPDIAELLMNTDDTSLRLGNGFLAGGLVIGGKPYKSVAATTAYTIANADQGHLVVFNNSSSCTVTIPQAGAARNMPDGAGFFALNIGTATAILTPTTSLINGAASLTLHTGDGATIFSDGTNYWAIKAISLGSSISLASLSDIILTSPSVGNRLMYDGTEWVNAGGAITKTANYTILTADNLGEFDNSGAGGSIILSLPPAANGLEYGFLVDAAQTLEVLANGSDIIHAAGLASTAGGNFSSTVQYSYLHLRAHSSGRWITTSLVGTWTAA